MGDMEREAGLEGTDEEESQIGWGRRRGEVEWKGRMKKRVGFDGADEEGGWSGRDA